MKLLLLCVGVPTSQEPSQRGVSVGQASVGKADKEVVIMSQKISYFGCCHTLTYSPVCKVFEEGWVSSAAHGLSPFTLAVKSW